MVVAAVFVAVPPPRRDAPIVEADLGYSRSRVSPAAIAERHSIAAIERKRRFLVVAARAAMVGPAPI